MGDMRLKHPFLAMEDVRCMRSWKWHEAIRYPLATLSLITGCLPSTVCRSAVSSMQRLPSKQPVPGSLREPVAGTLTACSTRTGGQVDQRLHSRQQRKLRKMKSSVCQCGWTKARIIPEVADARCCQ